MPKQCHHINAQSVFAGPWSMCFDCRVRHVRAAMDRFDGGVRITAGLGTILLEGQAIAVHLGSTR